MTIREIKASANMAGFGIPNPISGVLFGGEDQAHKFIISNQDGAAFSGTVSAKFLRYADNATVPLTGSIEAGKATVTLIENCYARPGRFKLTVYVTADGSTTAVYCCMGTVDRTDGSTTIDPSGEINLDVTDLINRINAATASVPADYTSLLATIAPTFSASTAYAAGDYVWYDGDLYRFTADHAAGAWAGTDATAAVVVEDVSELKSAVQDITGNTIYTFTNGVWYNTSSTVNINAPESTTAARGSCVVPCAYGDQFTLTGSGFTSTHMLWCFVDDSGTILSPHAGSSETAEEKIITAPYNATHLVVNAKTSEPRYLYGGVKVNLKLDILNDVDDVSIHSVDGAISEAAKTSAFTPDQFGHYYTSDGDGTYTSVYDRLTDDALFCCKLIPCLAGEIYHVHTYGHIGEKRGWIIFDTNGGRLKYCSTTGQVVDEYVTIPQNGAFLAINNKMDVNKECWGVKQQANEYFDFRGKNVAIIGDSISTNGDWSTDNPLGNVPEIIIQDADVGVELSAYITWWDVYTNAAGTSATNKSIGGHVFTADEIGTEVTFTPIADDVGKIVGKPKNNNAASQYVWWETAADKLGFNPIPVCWSGSSITSHVTDELDDGGYIYKCSHAWHPSQIRKCGVRIPGGMTRTPPDVVIIYRGTNDFSKSPYTRLTDYLDQYPFSIPETDEYDDNGTPRCDYQKGLAITIDKLRAAYPEAQIVLCTFNYFHRISSSLPGFPSRNGTNTIYQYNNAIRAVADYFGCHVIEFDKDGITYGNATNGYYNESGTSPTSNLTHPNDKGQKVLGNRALIDLKKINALV